MPTMTRPDDSVLTHNGIKVGVWFTGEADGRAAVMMPMFGGYFKTEEELKPYREASKIVAERLRKIGFVVE